MNENESKNIEQMRVPHEYEVRLNKVKKLRQLGIEPWPDSEPVDATCKQVHDEFDPAQEKKYSLAGRVMTLRAHGKTAFATIQDHTGSLQIYLKADILGDKFNFFEQFIDSGDILWVKGYSFKTKTGEITLRVEDFKLLSKSLYPLPEKFHGLTDIETRYRQRYLDLISSPESKGRFKKRSLIVRYIREFLDNHGYLEVETPMLHPIAGGAAAKPFVTHFNALDQDFYLRIAPELYLKRLLVGGFDKVYEINRNFRNEGLSTRHNPEFTMIEFYTIHKDYNFIMDFVEHMLREVVRHTNGSMKIQFGNYEIDFGKRFDRLSIFNAVKQHLSLTDKDLKGTALDSLLKQHAVKFNATFSDTQKIYALFEKAVEPKLIQPTFIIDFPVEVSPLAKRDAQNSIIAARFELFIAGMELANGFNELNDPLDQASRFEQQLEAFKAGDEEAHQFDADYVAALEHAMPPAVGVGLGIDRLTMIVTNTTSIRDVILFPTLKKK